MPRPAASGSFQIALPPECAQEGWSQGVLVCSPKAISTSVRPRLPQTLLLGACSLSTEPCVTLRKKKCHFGWGILWQ